MALTAPEDAASVLEQFVHDVANTPAEIAHLLEEIAAKDTLLYSHKEAIARRDGQLQKWVRANGGHTGNPNEEKFAKAIHVDYDRAEILQAEKCGLAEKALIVLERQIKRLDVSLRGLQVSDQFPADAGLPSMLGQAGRRVSTPLPSVGVGGGAGMAAPLQVVSGNVGSTGVAPTVVNAAQRMMAQQRAGGTVTPTQSAGGGAILARSQREDSADAKRRRLNASLVSLPVASSHLRQSSLGPGTPKAGTPGPLNPIQGTTSRAGSAQPRKAPAVAIAGRKPVPSGASQALSGGRKRVRTTTGTAKKGSRCSHLANAARGTPSTNASEGSDRGSTSASPTPSSIVQAQHDGPSDLLRSSRGRSHKKAELSDDEDGEGGEENDDTLYCFCQKVSYGDMVGCDNDDCRFQWFHWSCVGLKEEPKGEWLCPECSGKTVGRK